MKPKTSKLKKQSFFARHFSPENAAMNIITIAVLTVGAAYIALQVLRAMSVVNI